MKKAADAKTQTEQAKADENLKIAIAGSYGTDGKLNLKDLKDNLENQGIDYDKNNTGFPLEVIVNGEKKKIDANGNVTVKLESVADSKTNGTVFNDVTTLEDTYGNQVKIPKGFKIANDSATDVTGGNIKLVCKKEQQVWNYVTQNKASKLSRDMYGSEAKVTSDLINSYAWDTAIVFIQECGTENNSSTYSKTVGQSSTSTSASQTTGTNKLKATSKVDKQCNIFDMAGNCREWTTETYSDSNGFCVYRGGFYDYSYCYTSTRNVTDTSGASSRYSFRPLLYM